MRRIILASTSPRRKELLQKTGLKFEIVASDYKEDMTLPIKPKALAKFLSRGKALAVAKKYQNTIIVAADTFIAYGDEILGKPHTAKQAKITLTKLSGKAHSVITGFTIIDTKTGKILSQAEETKVYFKKLSSKEINGYIKTGEPLDRAGAYAIQGLGGVFVKKIDGDYDNVVGLPFRALVDALKKFGVRIF